MGNSTNHKSLQRMLRTTETSLWPTMFSALQVISLPLSSGESPPRVNTDWSPVLLTCEEHIKNQYLMGMVEKIVFNLGFVTVGTHGNTGSYVMFYMLIIFLLGYLNNVKVNHNKKVILAVILI